MNLNYDAAVGSLVGSAVGDALGAPFEFGQPNEYAAAFPTPCEEPDTELVGNSIWEPGEFTDDTQMALALAESLLAQNNFDADDLWTRWQAWAKTAKDVGILTRYALAHPTWDGAADAAETLNGGRSAGNGALMRNTPVGLLGAAQGNHVAEVISMFQAALTHNDRDTHTAAFLHATAIANSIRDHADPIDALDTLLEAYDFVAGWKRWLTPAWTPDDTDGLPNGTVWVCFAQAVWAVRSTSSFEDALVAAINLGGDTDTVACVTGSLAGARYGARAIPNRWLSPLHGYVRQPDGSEQTYTVTDLYNLADLLTAY